MHIQITAILLAVGCSGLVTEPDLVGFGDIASAFISSCAIQRDSGDLVPSAFGFVKARERSCGNTLEGVAPRFDSCSEYSNEDPWAVCPSVGVDALSTVMVFQFGAIDSPTDLTGESTSFLRLSKCEPDEEADIDSEYVPADIVVWTDDGSTAQVSIEGEQISGTFDVRICR